MDDISRLANQHRRKRPPAPPPGVKPPPLRPPSAAIAAAAEVNAAINSAGAHNTKNEHNLNAITAAAAVGAVGPNGAKPRQPPPRKRPPPPKAPPPKHVLNKHIMTSDKKTVMLPGDDISPSNEKQDAAAAAVNSDQGAGGSDPQTNANEIRSSIKDHPPKHAVLPVVHEDKEADTLRYNTKPGIGLSANSGLKDELLMLCTLGQGASGIVYKSLHLPTFRIVAIKTIPVFDANKRAQMVKELNALYANMTPIDHDTGVAGGAGGGVSVWCFSKATGSYFPPRIFVIQKCRNVLVSMAAYRFYQQNKNRSGPLGTSSQGEKVRGPPVITHGYHK
jgi:hypothetical protein